MPRKRQTRTGEDAQNIKSVPGVRYGEGVEQQAMQRAMPAPDSAGAPIAAAAPMPESMPIPPGAVPTAPDPAMVSQYLSQNAPNLFAGTQRPDEPITAGLASGPGPGPDSLALNRNQTPLSRYLQNLAAETGNSKWDRLREQANI